MASDESTLERSRIDTLIRWTPSFALTVALAGVIGFVIVLAGPW